jgi:hypothetical protein
MTATADMIITLGGTVLPLDQRRRDALANLAQLEAKAAGLPAQTWVRQTWGLKDYEAKDLLKGNSSEPVWERILKHPNGGWSVALPILGAVIGHDVEVFLQAQRKRHVEIARRHGALVRDLRARPASGRARAAELAPDPGERRGSDRR